LWLPQHIPDVLRYFRRLRTVVAQYPDILTPVSEEALHMTIQSINSHNAAGERVDKEQLAVTAAAIGYELRGLEPFAIEIGPPRASGSAAVADVFPEDLTAELNQRVRRGALASGIVLPSAEEHFSGHMAIGYGSQDTDSPVPAERSDRFASAIGRYARPGSRTQASISSIWLGWERQEVAHCAYTFQPVHELHLGNT
jgi:hypothetical protein